jgi:hypothetical protein
VSGDLAMALSEYAQAYTAAGRGTARLVVERFDGYSRLYVLTPAGHALMVSSSEGARRLNADEHLAAARRVRDEAAYLKALRMDPDWVEARNARNCHVLCEFGEISDLMAKGKGKEDWS